MVGTVGTKGSNVAVDVRRVATNRARLAIPVARVMSCVCAEHQEWCAACCCRLLDYRDAGFSATF